MQTEAAPAAGTRPMWFSVDAAVAMVAEAGSRPDRQYRSTITARRRRERRARLQLNIPWRGSTARGAAMASDAVPHYPSSTEDDRRNGWRLVERERTRQAWAWRRRAGAAAGARPLSVAMSADGRAGAVCGCKCAQRRRPTATVAQRVAARIAGTQCLMVRLALVLRPV